MSDIKLSPTGCWPQDRFLLPENSTIIKQTNKQKQQHCVCFSRWCSCLCAYRTRKWEWIITFLLMLAVKLCLVLLPFCSREQHFFCLIPTVWNFEINSGYQVSAMTSRQINVKLHNQPCDVEDCLIFNHVENSWFYFYSFLNTTSWKEAQESSQKYPNFVFTLIFWTIVVGLCQHLGQKGLWNGSKFSFFYFCGSAAFLHMFLLFYFKYAAWQIEWMQSNKVSVFCF